MILHTDEDQHYISVSHWGLFPVEIRPYEKPGRTPVTFIDCSDRHNKGDWRLHTLPIAHGLLFRGSSCRSQ